MRHTSLDDRALIAKTLNRITAGRAIPVKFSLTSNRGFSIFAAGYPTSQQIARSSGAEVDDIKQTVATATAR